MRQLTGCHANRTRNEKPIFYAKCYHQFDLGAGATRKEAWQRKLYRIMLQCIQFLFLFLSFFWPKIESRPNCVNFTSHFSNCFASRLRPVPLLPQTCMFVGTFSARNPEGVVLLLPRQAQLVHVDDIIVCLTIYTNYPPLAQVHQPARQTPKESRSQPPSLCGSLTCSKWILLL